MLICPQCEFENPRANKFCQNCGVSLTHKACCQCHEEIPVEAEVCSMCGAANHTVLWAIISLEKSVVPTKLTSESVATEKGANSDRQLEISSLFDLFANTRTETNHSLPILTNKEYTSNRYVLQHSNSKPLLETKYSSLDGKYLQGKVIDRYPLQKSHLATLQKQQIDLFTELSQDLNDSYLSVREYWNLVGLPIHALPYLILERYTPTVPKIYDAWQQQDRGVVLLPDRSEWNLMTELWSQQKPLPQIIWFLDEMAKLWQPLKKIGCARSLLFKDNLLVDEDQSFCLQQLYLDFDDSPSLKDLAHTWQLCFAESNLSNLDNLSRMLERIISGEIVAIEHLRLELQNLGIDDLELESPDFYPNFSTMNISPSESEMSESEFNSGTSELPDFFDEADESMMYTSELEEEATIVVPLQLKSITAASCTDIGSQRDHNEDFFGVRTQTEKVENNTENSLWVRGLYVVCDGMGGHAAGEVASAMAVENLQTYFQTHWRSQLPDSETIERGILLANKALYQTNINNSRSGSGRMGTTLVMALVQNTQLAIAHVGDSRIYRLSRKQGLEQLTIDHEVGQREINRGVEPEIAYGRPDAYQLTQALGPRENKYVRPEIQFIDITEDCLILLCSDGLSDYEFIEQNWSQYLKPLIKSEVDLQRGLFEFVELANQHNGHDNITAVLLRIKLKPNF